MKPNFNKNKSLRELAVLAISLFSLTNIQSLSAVPTSLKPFPEVKIPMDKGKTLPVEILPGEERSDRGKPVVYVVPLAGEFEGEPQEFISPVVDCRQIRDKVVKLRELDNAESPVIQALARNADQLEASEADIERKIEAKNKTEAKFNAQQDEVNRLDEVFQKRQEETLTAEQNAMSAATNLQLAMASNDEAQIAVAKDANTAAQQNLIIARGAKDRAFMDLQGGKQKLNQLKRAMGQAKAAVDSLEQAATAKRAERNNLVSELGGVRTRINGIVDEISAEDGGYVRVMMHFAPPRYLEMLEDANPQFSFRYVPIVAGEVDLSIPEVKNPELVRRGKLIHDVEFSGRKKENDFYAQLVEAIKTSDEPLSAMSQMTMQSADALTGLAEVNVNLTPYGVCALTDPRLFEDQFTSRQNGYGTIALSYNFAYPVKYHVRAEGSVKKKKIVHEFYKRYKSSGFFGIGAKDRQEYIKNVTDKETVNISVSSNSPIFGPAEAEKMREKIAEMIAFGELAQYMDLNSNPPIQSVDINSMAQNKARRGVIGLISAIPSPWAKWGGALAEGMLGVLGGQTSKWTADQVATAERFQRIDEEFMIPHAGRVSIGAWKDFHK